MVQPPNVPILLWLVFTLVAHFVSAAPWHAIAAIISTIALIVWALLEIVDGDSYFRRTLGAFVLIIVLCSRFLG